MLLMHSLSNCYGVKMSIRTIIFCDHCNPLGLRTINDRFTKNRRLGDYRTWYEGNLEEAHDAGWRKSVSGHDLCPKCYENRLDNQIKRKKDVNSRRFVGLIRTS